MRRFLFAVIILLASACGSTSKMRGTLEGHVNIGPLVPVVRQGQPEPTPAPEVYAARRIVIYARGGQKEIARLEIDAQGDYRTELPPGQYVVDINRIGIDRGIDLPQTVQVASGQVTRLDIEIDTGIR